MLQIRLRHILSCLLGERSDTALLLRSGRTILKWGSRLRLVQHNLQLITVHALGTPPLKCTMRQDEPRRTKY